jgi:hypothetical protein
MDTVQRHIYSNAFIIFIFYLEYSDGSDQEIKCEMLEMGWGDVD